jgi:hypothetical protein
LSKRRPDREDILLERRAKVVTLAKDGLSMSRIAIELGTSIDCVFRDVKAIRRFQTSTADRSIEPEDSLKSKGLSQKPSNIRRRAQKRYFCLNCSNSWSGKGSWKPARLHGQTENHSIAQGTAERHIVRWQANQSRLSVITS